MRLIEYNVRTIGNLLVQLISLILHVLEELLRALTILLLFLISEQIVGHQLWMYNATTTVQLLILLLGPDIVRVLSQTLGHILHFSAECQVAHIHRMWIVVERTSLILKIMLWVLASKNLSRTKQFFLPIVFLGFCFH